MKKITVKIIGNPRKYYEIFYSAVLCIGLISLAGSLFSLPYPPIAFILFSFFIQFLIHWSEEKNLRFQFWIGFVILLGLIGLFIYAGGKNLAPYLYFLGLVAICVPTCIVCYLACQRLWLKASICILLLASLIAFGIQRITLPKWTVCLILFCFLLFLAELSCAFSEGKYGQKILYLTPFFFLSILFLFLLPVRETPIKWNTVKNMIKAVREELTSLIISAEYFFSSGNGSYTLSFAGYNESGELKGNVLSSDNPRLSIVGDQTKAPLYLTGNIHDFYNGHGWENHASEKPYDEDEYLMQYDGLMSAFSQSIYSEEEIKELTNYSDYNITFAGLKTKSLFFAPLTQNIILFDDKMSVSSFGDVICLSKAQGVGFSYRIQLMEVNYSDERVKQLLRGYAWKGIPVLTKQAAMRQEFIYRNYTLLPEDLPERIYSLAAEITAEADNDYDRLKAIENYLSKYTYTTSPGLLSEDEDVVDYFLFNSKTGYCTYFASAMAVLGRCEGIPTRYAEGFVSNGACRYNCRDLNLSGNNAHAWVEAYIENIGWIPFEPTPRYYNASNTAWKQAGEVTVTIPGTQPSVPATAPNLSSGENEMYEISYLSFWENGKNFLFFILECLIFLFIGFIVIALLLFLRSRLWHHIYISGTDYEKIQFHMKKAFQIGKLYGYPIESNETLSDYGTRTGGCLDTPEYSFSEICNLFQSIRFGGCPISEENIKIMKKYTLSLQKQYLKQCGRMKRLLFYMWPTL
ncbi:MAG: transglutaminase domain-containing protein [Clostridiales bacterium]|nr:transglutaminase domain-containing protein [Clostridiales bacterium]